MATEYCLARSSRAREAGFEEALPFSFCCHGSMCCLARYVVNVTHSSRSRAVLMSCIWGRGIALNAIVEGVPSFFVMIYTTGTRSSGGGSQAEDEPGLSHKWSEAAGGGAHSSGPGTVQCMEVAATQNCTVLPIWA
eukprot:scaffold139680_cov23-Tisochrysis_lutea.AAC.1